MISPRNTLVGSSIVELTNTFGASSQLASRNISSSSLLIREPPTTLLRVFVDVDDLYSCRVLDRLPGKVEAKTAILPANPSRRGDWQINLVYPYHPRLNAPCQF